MSGAKLAHRELACAAQLQLAACSVTFSGLTKGWRSTIGKLMPAGSLS